MKFIPIIGSGVYLGCLGRVFRAYIWCLKVYIWCIIHTYGSLQRRVDDADHVFCFLGQCFQKDLHIPSLNEGSKLVVKRVLLTLGVTYFPRVRVLMLAVFDRITVLVCEFRRCPEEIGSYEMYHTVVLL